MFGFLTYFLAGMFVEELFRKIATRPFGFMIVWLMWTVLVTIVAIVFLYSLAFLTLVRRSAESYAGEIYVFSDTVYIARGRVVFLCDDETVSSAILLRDWAHARR